MKRALLVLVLLLGLAGCGDDRPCLRSHLEQRWMPDQISMIPMNNSYIPIITPGYEYTATVCDQYAPKGSR